MTSSVSVSVVILLLLLGPVSSETVNPAILDLISRNSDFAVRMFRAVSSRTDDNVLLSPFGLSAGLMALLSSTEGQTREQLQQGLTLNGLNIQDLPGQFRIKAGLVLVSTMRFESVFAGFRSVPDSEDHGPARGWDHKTAAECEHLPCHKL